MLELLKMTIPSLGLGASLKGSRESSVETLLSEG